MQRTQVQSSNIKSIGHDRKTKQLHVEFNSGKVYCYEGVTDEEHKALMGASSKGSHFHKHIKSRKKCSEL
jgi:hypothetical protein